MQTSEWAIEKIKEAAMKKANHLNLTPLRGRNIDLLKVFPEQILELTWLETLTINSSELQTLPEEIANLENLTTLNLRNNQIDSLPESLSELRNLKTLILNNNRLTSLPDTLTGLKNLKTLILFHNQLTYLPATIIQLQSLEVLDLSQNQIVSLPQGFSRLKNLIALNLSNNALTFVEDEVYQLEKLRSLTLHGNPLVAPPLEIALKGIVAVREYFRQIYKEGQDFLYEAKFIILGEGGAGKTTLAQKIKNSAYTLHDERSTEGVDVLQWSFSTDERKSFRLNIWDFGGQEIYHATHQFFLTKRSLYALVADTRKEDTDFYYWLSVVELLSDNSPLLIIKNEKQDRHREINERQLRGQFENLKAVLPVNLATNRGLDNVIKEIKHYAKLLPHIGSPLPKTWIRVREILESDSRYYISLEEYLDICKRNGFSDTKDSMQLSGYLHDIGVFLHFQDDSLLRKTVGS